MVYFVSTGNGLIKIGTTINFYNRMRDLRYTHKSPLKLLGFMPGGLAEEQEVHQQFRHLRIDNAWHAELFHPGPDLMEFIESLESSIKSLPCI